MLCSPPIPRVVGKCRDTKLRQSGRIAENQHIVVCDRSIAALLLAKRCVIRSLIDSIHIHRHIGPRRKQIVEINVPLHSRVYREGTHHARRVIPGLRNDNPGPAVKRHHAAGIAFFTFRALGSRGTRIALRACGGTS